VKADDNRLNPALLSSGLKVSRPEMSDLCQKTPIKTPSANAIAMVIPGRFEVGVIELMAFGLRAL
jgi:hypothetical protein